MSTPTRRSALSALRDGRVAVLLADGVVLAPTPTPPVRVTAYVTAYVTSSRSDPANPTGYFVDLHGGLWTCTRRRDGCTHLAAVQMVTGHPSAAAKEGK